MTKISGWPLHLYDIVCTYDAYLTSPRIHRRFVSGLNLKLDWSEPWKGAVWHVGKRPVGVILDKGRGHGSMIKTPGRTSKHPLIWHIYIGRINRLLSTDLFYASTSPTLLPSFPSHSSLLFLQNCPGFLLLRASLPVPHSAEARPRSPKSTVA